MDPTAFYHLGLSIMASTPIPDPASCRTVIGRAYYAARNRADEALDRWCASCCRGPQKHGLAVRFLHATSDSDLISASADLNDLKTLRNMADYDMNAMSVEKPSQARRALDLAKGILEGIAAVENDVARTRAAEANVRAYRRRTNTP